jgi:hypothetical protein
VITSIEDKLAALTTMSSAQLQGEWRALKGTPAPLISPSLLRLTLGYELQARALGGLSRVSQQRLAQLGAAKTVTQAVRPGTRLIREWNGVAHIVEVGEDGVIRWNGAMWNSLSEVAGAITGTPWSGPAFFGLKSRVPERLRHEPGALCDLHPQVERQGAGPSLQLA